MFREVSSTLRQILYNSLLLNDNDAFRAIFLIFFLGGGASCRDHEHFVYNTKFCDFVVIPLMESTCESLVR